MTRHTRFPQPCDTWVDQMFLSLEQAIRLDNTAVLVGDDLNTCLQSGGNSLPCAKAQVKD